MSKRVPVYLSVDEMRQLTEALGSYKENNVYYRSDEFLYADKLQDKLYEIINLNEEPEITGATLEAANEEDYEQSLKDCK